MTTRKEQIEKAANIHAEYQPEGLDSQIDDVMHDSFIEGCEWADAFWLEKLRELLNGCSDDGKIVQEVRKLISGQSS